MTAIWRDDGSGWRLLDASGFPDEAALNGLIERAPHILPLAGSPRLTIVGREVPLANGYVDLLAVEPTGRPAIIEVKLARNAEARRAVIAQVLSYAAHTQGLDATLLERDLLGRYLYAQGHANLAAAVTAHEEDGLFDTEAFAAGLNDCLREGRFRLVLILDEAPAELVRLVGYLQQVTTDRLLIDLITVTSYQVGESQILVPQRVDPERVSEERPAPPTPRPAPPEVQRVPGAAVFQASFAEAAPDQRPALQKLHDWAMRLEDEGLARLFTSIGKGRWALLPRLRDEEVGLCQLWHDKKAAVTLSGTVLARRAPQTLAQIEQMIAPATVGQGKYAPFINDSLLDALTAAYREAAGGAVTRQLEGESPA